MVSGNPDTVHVAGISVRGRTLSDEEPPAGFFGNHVVTWPIEDRADPALAGDADEG